MNTRSIERVSSDSISTGEMIIVKTCTQGVFFVLGLASGVFAFAEDTPMKHEALTWVVRDAEKAKPAEASQKPDVANAGDVPSIFTHTPAPLDDDSSKKKEASAESKEADPMVTLPKMEIYGKRLDALKRELDSNDWASNWEERLTHPSGLDEALNSVSIPLFGGSTAQSRAEQAKARVRLLEFERQLIVAIDLTSSAEEKKNLRKFLEEIRSMRRGYGYGDTFRGGK